MSEVVQELTYQIGADVSDLKKKVGEVSEATNRVKEAGGGIGEKLTEEFTHAVSSVGPLTGAVVEFAGVLTGVAAVVAGLELAKTFVEASIEAQAASARITAATGATGEKLAQLQEIFERVNVTVTASEQEVAVAVSAVTAKLGLSGDAAESAARSMLQLAKVTGTDLGSVLESVPKILAGFSVPVSESAATFDTLVRTTQATGVSLGTLQGILVSAGPAFRQLGLDAEQASALVGALEQSGIDAGAAVGSLRIFLQRASQAGLDAGGAFRDVVARIRDAKTESEALAESQQTFGRQFVQVADFIRRTGFDLDGFVDKVRKVPPDLKTTAAESATLGDEFAKLGKSIQNLVENAGFIVVVRDRVHELGLAVQALADVKLPSFAQLRGESGAIAGTQSEIKDAADKARASLDAESAAYARNAAAAGESAAKNIALEAAHDGAAEAARKSADAAAKEAAAHQAEVASLNAVDQAFGAGLKSRDGLVKSAEAANQAAQQLAQGLRSIAAQALSQGAAFNEPEAKLKLFQTTVQALTAAGVPLEQALALVGRAVQGIDTTDAVAQVGNLREAAREPIKVEADASPVDGLVEKLAEAKRSGGTVSLVVKGDALALEDVSRRVAEVRASTGEPAEIKITDAEALRRVDEVENRLADAAVGAVVPIRAEAGEFDREIARVRRESTGIVGDVALRPVDRGVGEAVAGAIADVGRLREATLEPFSLRADPSLIKAAGGEVLAEVGQLREAAAEPLRFAADASQPRAEAADLERTLAAIESPPPIDLRLDTGDSRTRLAEIQDDARRVGLEVTKTKNAGGEIVLELKSGPVLDAAGQIKAGLDAIPKKVDVELDLKIKSEAKAFEEEVRKATAELDIFGAKFAEIPATIGAAFPQLASTIRSSGTEFGRLSTIAQAKANEIKKALADGFGEGSAQVTRLRGELQSLEAGATVPITADISAIGDAISTIGAEIAHGAPPLKITADLSAAQAAIDAERQRIASLPTVEARVSETLKLDKAQAELDLAKFRADAAQAITVPLKAEDLGRSITSLREVGNVASSADLANTAAQFQRDVAAAIAAGNKAALAELIQAGRQFANDAQAGFAKLAQLTGGGAIPGDLSASLRKINLTISTAGGFAAEPGAAGTGFKDDPVAQAIADAQRKTLEQQQQANVQQREGNDIARSTLIATQGIQRGLTSGSFATDVLKKQQDAAVLSGVSR